MEELTPITRREVFLAKASGQEVETPTPITREEVFLDAIAKGGGLPPVTSSDNGKVLGVVDGAWAAQSNLFVVTITGTMNKADKTYNEIVAAVQNGKNVIAVYQSQVFPYAGQESIMLFFANTGNGGVGGIFVTSSNVVGSWSNGVVPVAYVSDVNGTELVIKNGAWAKQAKKFVVTLTPTSLDYSGTMDKTPEEISAAYEDGMEIVFRVTGVPGYDYVDVKAMEAILWTDRLWQMSAYLIMLPDMLIYFYNELGGATYSTKVYALTPAS